MKNTLLKLAPVALAWLASAACARQPPADLRPRVLVSNPPTAWLVRQIAGDRVIVQTLAHAGGCGHEFQPTDKDMVDASRAKIWFTCGLEFETSPWAKRLHVDTFPLAGPDRAPQASHEWMGLENLRRMAMRIETGCAEVVPEAARAGAAPSPSPAGLKLRDALAARHAKLRSLLLPLAGTTFLADHGAYTHFAADYNLRQLVIEPDDHEPTDAGVAKVVAQAKAAQAKVLFLSSEEHRREAEAVARAAGAQVVLADPNRENTPELLEMMADTLVKAHGQ